MPREIGHHHSSIVCKWGEEHINNSLKQIDSNTWLIGRLLLRRSPYLSDTATWNDDGDNSSYLLTEAPTPLPPAITPPNSPHIKLVHEAGDASAVWSIGHNAFCMHSTITDPIYSSREFQEGPSTLLGQVWTNAGAAIM